MVASRFYVLKQKKTKKKTLKFHVFNVEFNPKYSTFMFKEKCPLLSLHEKPTLTPKVLNALQCSTYQKKKALPLNVGFNPTSPKIKEKYPMLSLQDKPTLTPKVLNALQCSTYQKKKALPLNVGFNPTSPKIKEKYPMLSLQDKPTLTPSGFNAPSKTKLH